MSHRDTESCLFLDAEEQQQQKQQSWLRGVAQAPAEGVLIMGVASFHPLSFLVDMEDFLPPWLGTQWRRIPVLRLHARGEKSAAVPTLTQGFHTRTAP